jgi:hypothetical protein
MNSMVDRIMKDEKQAHELYSRILDKKITRVVLEKAQTTTKEVTWDEFLKLIDTKKEEAADAPKKTRRSSASKKEDTSEEVKPADKKPSTKKTKKENTEQQSLFE